MLVLEFKGQGKTTQYSATVSGAKLSNLDARLKNRCVGVKGQFFQSIPGFRHRIEYL